MSLAEPDHFAHGSVDERLVDILDEHDLGVFFENDMFGGHHIGQDLVSRIVAWAGSLKGQRMSARTTAILPPETTHIHGIVRPRLAPQLLQPCLIRSLHVFTSREPVEVRLFRNRLERHITRTATDLQLGRFDPVGIVNLPLQPCKPRDRRGAHLAKPHLVEHVDKRLITLPKHLCQVDTGRNGLVPRGGFKRKRRRLVVFRHGRQLEKVARHHDLPVVQSGRKSRSGVKGDATHLDTPKRPIRFSSKDASDLGQLVEQIPIYHRDCHAGWNAC